MSSALLIRLADNPAESAWCTHDATGRVLESGGGLAGWPATSGAGRVVVLVPATSVILGRVQLPTRRRAQMLLAAPYAMEDLLATEVEDMHFALGREFEDGSVEVAAVSIADMEDWLSTLAGFGIQPDAVMSEAQAIPDEHLVVDQTSAILRAGALVQGADTDVISSILRHANVQAETLTVIDLREDKAQFLPLAAAAVSAEGGVNLMQAGFARHSAMEQWWARWRWPAGLAAVLALTFLLETGVEVWQLKNARQELISRSQERLNEVFPEAPVTEDPRLEMRRAVAELRASKGMGGDGGFLALLREVGPDVAQDANVQLEEIQFRNNQLEFLLTFTNVESLDRFRARLEANNGLLVEVLSATTGEDGVSGRIRIASAGRPV